VTTFENQQIIAFSMMQKCNMSEASLRFFPNNCCRETVESLRHLVVRGRAGKPFPVECCLCESAEGFVNRGGVARRPASAAVRIGKVVRVGHSDKIFLFDLGEACLTLC